MKIFFIYKQKKDIEKLKAMFFDFKNKRTNLKTLLILQQQYEERDEFYKKMDVFYTAFMKEERLNQLHEEISNLHLIDNVKLFNNVYGMYEEGLKNYIRLLQESNILGIDNIKQNFIK